MSLGLNSYLPLGSYDPRYPMSKMPCDRDKDVEDGIMPIIILQQKKSMVVDASTIGVKVGEKNKNKEGEECVLC